MEAVVLVLMALGLAVVLFVIWRRTHALQVITPSNNEVDFLRLSQQVAHVGSWDWDIVNNTIQWSDEMCRLHGQDPATFKPAMATALSCYTAADQERITAGIQKSLQNGWNEPSEYRVRLPDGGERVHWVNWQTIFDATGKPVRMIGVNLDITERKHAEEEIHRINTDLQNRIKQNSQSLTDVQQLNECILAGSTQGIIAYSDNGTCVFANNAISKLLGATHEQLMQQDFRRIHSWQQSGLIDCAETVLQTGLPQTREVHVMSTFSKKVWLECHFSRFLRDKTPHLLCIISDIAARKYSELSLLESEEKFRLITETIQEVFWMADVTISKMLYVSPGYERIWRRTRQSLYDNPRSFMESIHPDDRERVINGLLIERQGNPFDHEYRIMWPDGTLRWIRDRGFPVTESDGTINRYVGVAQDITLQKELQLTTDLAHDAAVRANQAKSEFLSSMSHELRTPLNAINGFAQLLCTDTTLTKDQNESATEILKAGNHLLGLINDILDLAKIEAGKLTISLEEVQLSPLLREVIALMQPLASKNAIQIKLQAEDNLIVTADRMRLRQVLLNLLSNAVKYNRPNGQVTVRIEPDSHEFWRVLVQDTGTGIPNEKHAQLFEVFNRLGNENSTEEGTGIGLVITRRLVLMMKGTIGFNSTAGVGSTFWFTLPRSSSSPAEYLPESLDLTIPAPLAMTTKPNTVLYIEDNPVNIRLVVSLLAKRPHLTLLTAHNPKLGIELADAHRPDVILLDINLPGMDGFEVLQRLRQQDWARTVPIIAVSANVLQRDIERGMTAGFHAYLTKPLDIRQFYLTIDHFTADKQSSVASLT